MPQRHSPAVLRVTVNSQCTCPLCNQLMQIIEGSRLCCHTENCRLEGVKYDLPILDLQHSVDQSEPAPVAHETTRPGRKEKQVA